MSETVAKRASSLVAECAEEAPAVAMPTVTPPDFPDAWTDVNASAVVAMQLEAFSLTATGLRTLADRFDEAAAGRLEIGELTTIARDRIRTLAKVVNDAEAHTPYFAASRHNV